MPEVTFCIPIGPNHLHIAERAIQSAAAQTMPVEVLTMVDEAGQGPAVLRNAMLAEVNSEFVVFLDADDAVEPTFAEETVAEYRRTGGDKYIFTDWYNAEGQIVNAPVINNGGTPVSQPGKRPYCGGTWHVITTLLPTQWVRVVGGFDESLPAIEDTDFYLKLCTSMRCGHHLARPLFHYAPNGPRSTSFQGNSRFNEVMQSLTLRYGGKMGCCGQDDNTPIIPVGEKQPGDVLVMALWQGNRGEYGRVTGRHYPRMSMPRTAWIDPRDANASPNLWKIMPAPPAAHAPQAVDQGTGLSNLQQMAAMGLTRIVKSPYAPPTDEPPVPPVTAQPNVSRVVRLANKAMGISDNTANNAAVQQIATQTTFDVLKQVIAPKAKPAPTNGPTVDFSVVANAANEQIQRSITPPTVHLRTDPVFIFPEKDYPSYRDIKKLAQLSGFKVINFKQIDAFSRVPYIVVSPEPLNYDFAGLPAKVVCWQLEYAGDYTHNYDSFGGVIWSSDKAWADTHKAQYVLLGSHPGLAGEHPGEADWLYDVTMLAYMTPRRAAIKAQLPDLKWAPDYPGHGTDERNQVLHDTRLMLHVHQHDNASYVAPQRFAVAAAYKMNMLIETTPGLGDLIGCVEWSLYADLPMMAREASKYTGQALYERLCVERTFRACVEAALK